MNIFYLDKDPIEIAKAHHNKHLVCMIKEKAQLLSTTIRICDESYADTCYLYKLTHPNHPCNKWLRASKQHFMFTVRLFKALHDEYVYRYGRTHLSFDKCYENIVNWDCCIEDNGWIDPPAVVPSTCRQKETVIETYRECYRYFKVYNIKGEFICKYKDREPHVWLIPMLKRLGEYND